MANYGMIIRRPDGKFWMSPDVTPLTFQYREDRYINNNGVNSFLTNIPVSRPFLVFARRLDGSSWSSFEYYRANGFWGVRTKFSMITPQTPATIRFYYFSNIPRIDSNFGTVFRNELGEVTWSADSLPLQMQPYSMEATSYTTNVGATCAVTPMFCMFQVEAYFPGTPPIWMYGSYAFMASGNTVSRELVAMDETTAPWEDRPTSTTFYAINTELYDL
ncbi:TPA: hypothetical protein PFE09_002195 [Kluyvera ascorbata]|nr:hypothetical protein [Kluyvera ascorbata]